ncbi:DUF4937 domain-containing protein [Falsibacillus albus]|uniref:DUF4937 domain-containing protein n=1 Tax=Falsibacillus albus TaxID=2478915 RepID=A0A3L7JQU2_9BACI|nr:DUF4937 domain-containing protein [Falsibacillus albus]RLQ93187.1 DUF4937 domain-containing protein [Falsibacillus albus]
MLIKHITCFVDEESREAFSRSQDEWVQIQSVPGLMWQLGGWKNEREAHIWGIWTDEVLYEDFMKKNHDTIYDKAEQDKNYHSISISFKKIEAIENMDEFLMTIQDNDPFIYFIDGEQCMFKRTETLQEGEYKFVASWLVCGLYP